MAVLNRPDVYVGVAFNADPFDANAVPVWSDLTSRVYRISSAKRGRQYELDRNQAGSLSIDWHNVDEALNPVNTGSPFWPNVLPYRQILVRAMWPNGGTGNLINSLYNSTDGSFESYAAGPAPSWLTAVGGVSAVIATTTPQQGTKCVSYSVAGTATAQGLSWVVPCIPGRQYTASGYVRQSSASTQQISVVGGATGTSTTTTGAYVRLTVTFTATQPTHTVQLATTGTAVIGTVLIDALQCEPGASASAFTTSGPMIRNVWTRGYIERWPIGWVDGGFRGITVTPGVGPLAILANANLHTEVGNSIMAKKPLYYWPLQEPQGALYFAETSGTAGGTPLGIWTSPNGIPTPLAAGTNVTPGLVGDAGGNGVKFTADLSSSLNQRGQVLITAPQGGSTTYLPTGIPATPATPWAITVSLWVNTTTPYASYAGSPILIAFKNSIVSWAADVPVYILLTGASQLDGVMQNSSNFSGAAVLLHSTGTATITDGKWHHLVATASQDNTNSFVTLYVDGVQIGTGTVPTSGFPLLGTSAKTAEVGGSFGGVQYNGTFDGVIAHVAVWNRNLSGSEITDLWTAGSKGFAGETEGARIGRYLAYGGYTGPTNIQTGASTMGPGTVAEGDALLDSCQQATDSAFGNFFEDANGVAFASRFDRYQRTTASYTFGEQVGSGEYPYEDDLTYDFDPTQVLNVADVSRSGGIKAHAEDATQVSQKRYGRKNFTRTIDIASDNETLDAATWVVANRKDPHLRIAAITFEGGRVSGLTAGDGTLWPMLLNLEIGTRVTVKRRPKAANGGVGITMSNDYFVESIEHHDIDFQTGDWKTTLLLSPVTVAQPWILENATYGLLDSTTVLGF